MCVCVCVYGIQGRLFEPLSRKNSWAYSSSASFRAMRLYIYIYVCVSVVFKEGFSTHYQEKNSWA